MHLTCVARFSAGLTQEIYPDARRLCRSKEGLKNAIKRCRARRVGLLR